MFGTRTLASLLDERIQRMAANGSHLRSTIGVGGAVVSGLVYARVAAARARAS